MDIIIIFVGANALLIEVSYDDIQVNSWKVQTLHNMNIIDKNMNVS